MKIIIAIKSGLSRSLKSWKGILVSWFVSLTLVSMLVLPVKAGLNEAFDSSMVTEKLMNGLNFDVLGDLGNNLHSMGSSLFAGTILLSLAAILMNIFISGGLFNSVRQATRGSSSQEFFRASSKNFWPFLLISLALYLIVAVLIVLIVIVPVSIAANSETAPEGIVFRTLSVSLVVFLAAMSIIYLVSDYARALQASGVRTASFRSLLFGFSQTFKTFLTSFPLMVIVFIFQVFLGVVTIKIIAGYTPVTGPGVFALFVISQLLIVIKIFLKVMRFGSVTSLMENNAIKLQEGKDYPDMLLLDHDNEKLNTKANE